MTQQAMERMMSLWLKAFLFSLTILAGTFTSYANQIPALIEALGDPNDRLGASIALTNLGALAVPSLQESLNSADPDVRVWSASTLGQIGSDARPALGALIGAVGSRDVALRAAAVQALGKIGDPAVVDALVSALSDENVKVRRESATGLGRIGPAAHSAAPQLIVALADESVRPHARNALVQIGQRATDALLDSLGEDKTRFDVSLVLQTVNPALSRQQGLTTPQLVDVPSLRIVLHDTSRSGDDQATAANHLAALGEDGFAILVEAFESQSIATYAAEAFANTDEAAVPTLIRMLTHEDPAVRARAADALGYIGHAADGAVADLVRLLKDENRDVRYHAVRALHEIGQPAAPAVPALSEAILNSGELEPTRQWAIKALVVTLPETHDAVVETLIAASNEKTSYGVRQLARQQLRKIDLEAATAAGIE